MRLLGFTLASLSLVAGVTLSDAIAQRFNERARPPDVLRERDLPTDRLPNFDDRVITEPLQKPPTIELDVNPADQPLGRQQAPAVVAPSRPAPPRTESERRECEVREFKCVEYCESLAGKWPSDGECLQRECRIESKNCLEVLLEALERRRAQQEIILTFQVRNAYRYQAQIKFYSRARGVSWPGSGSAYDLNDREIHIYDLRCRRAEPICYGAWVTGTAAKTWGAGPGGRQGCSSCCATCGTVDAVSVVLD
jgi:hypothetical protein